MSHVSSELAASLGDLLAQPTGNKYQTKFWDVLWRFKTVFCGYPEGERLLVDWSNPLQGLIGPETQFGLALRRATPHLDRLWELFPATVERLEQKGKQVEAPTPSVLQLCLCLALEHTKPWEVSPGESEPKVSLSEAAGRCSPAEVLRRCKDLRRLLDLLSEPTGRPEPEEPLLNQPELPPSPPPKDADRRREWEQKRAAHFAWRDSRRLRDEWEQARDELARIEELWQHLGDEGKVELERLREEIQNVISVAANDHGESCYLLLDLHRNGYSSGLRQVLRDREVGGQVAKGLQKAADALVQELDRQLQRPDAPSDGHEGVPVSPSNVDAGNTNKTAKLKNWAIGCDGEKWWLFQWFKNLNKWCDRGNVDVPKGRVTKLAGEFIRKGGFISKEDAIKLFRTEECRQMTTKYVFDSICKPTCRKLASCTKKAIQRAAKANVPKNPIPWDQTRKGWKCECEIGYAIKEENRLLFRTQEQEDAKNKLDSREVNVYEG